MANQSEGKPRNAVSPDSEEIAKALTSPSGRSIVADNFVTGKVQSYRMNLLLVEEDDLDELSATNDRAKTFHSLSTFLLGSGIVLAIEPLFMGVPFNDIAPVTRAIAWVGGAIAIIVGAVFVRLSKKEAAAGKSKLTNIKERAGPSIGFTMRSTLDTLDTQTQAATS